MKAATGIMLFFAIAALCIAESTAARTKQTSTEQASQPGNIVSNPGFEKHRSTSPFNLSNPEVIPSWELKASILPPPENYTASGIFGGCASHTGGFATLFGSREYPDNLTQTLATVKGAKYKVSFWLFQEVNGTNVQRDSLDTPSNPRDGRIIYMLPSTSVAHPRLTTNNYFNVQINEKNSPTGSITPMTATYKFPFAMAPYTAYNIPASYKPFLSAKYPNIPYNNVDAFPWVQYTFKFKATSAATRLTFQGTNRGAYTAIDDVSVVQTTDTSPDLGYGEWF